jgi:lipoate-protein ligase A
VDFRNLSAATQRIFRQLVYDGLAAPDIDPLGGITLRMNRKLMVASVLALAVTAGGGVLSTVSVHAAAAAQMDNEHAGGRSGICSAIVNTELTALLGLTADELKTERKAGKSLAVIAAEQSIEVQKVIDLEVTLLTAALNKELEKGQITQAQYDTQKASLETKATELVNSTFSAKTEDGARGGKGRGGHAAILQDSSLAALLGLTTEELETAVKSGKSLATLAGEKGVSVQAVLDQVTSTLTAQLDQKLAAGTLTQAQYDEKKAALSAKATEVVNGTFKGRDEAGEGKGGPGRHSDKAAKDDTASLDGTTGTAAVE